MTSSIASLRRLLRGAVVPALALLTAFVLGAIVIVLTDFDHLQQLGTDPVAALGGAIGGLVDGYGAMFSGAIGDPGRVVAAIQSGSERDIARAIRPATEALLSATPLIFVCLGIGVALHARLFNFGANGQFLMGGLGATIGAITLNGLGSPFVILVAAVVAGTLFGAAYGFVPGLLKARTGAHEVITTIMLNTIAAQIVLYVLRFDAFSASLPSITSVPRLVDLPTIRLDSGFIVALLTAAVVSFLLFRTNIGFELRATGFSGTAARSAGMRPGRAIVVAMSLSGGLVGMGGALVALGPTGGLSGSNDGLVALALALIAGLRPSRIVLAALLYGALNNGARSMVIATGTPLALLDVVIAITLTFVAAPSLIRTMWRLQPPRSAAENASIIPPGPSDALAL